jgi:hypothetical protein
VEPLTNLSSVVFVFSLTQVTAGLSGILKNRMHRLVGFHLEIAEQFGYTQLPGKGPC